MSENGLDDLDMQLINVLAKDARVSNRKIATELGVTEGTVRGRIKRLQQDGMIAFTALTSFGMAKQKKMAILGIQVDVDKVHEVAGKIAEMGSISGVLITIGRFNIMAICIFDELEALHSATAEKILTVPGVHHIETSIAVKTVKYNARTVKITDQKRILNGN